MTVERASLGPRLGGLRLCALDTTAVAEIRAFLVGTFGESAFFDTPLLEWKYFQPRSDWSQSRSWVLRNAANAIVAHVGLWPFHLMLPDGPEPTWQPIDWVGSRDVPGAGAELFDRVHAAASVRLAIGGTPKARKVLPTLGYVDAGRVDTFVRVVRPWAHFLARPRPVNLRQTAALARHAIWKRPPKSTRPPGWDAEPLQSFSSLVSLLAPQDRLTTRTDRTAERLNYLLACPANCSAYVLLVGGEAVGYALFSHRWGQTRIADLWVAPGHERLWTDACATAVDIATGMTHTCELIATASTDRMRRVLAASGFHLAVRRTIWLKDPAGVMRLAPPLDLQAIDSDAYFGGRKSSPFLS